MESRQFTSAPAFTNRMAPSRSPYHAAPWSRDSAAPSLALRTPSLMRTGNRHNCAELLTQVADGGERDFHRQPRVGHANSLETSAQPKTFPKRRLFRGGEVIRETQSDNTAVAVGR